MKTKTAMTAILESRSERDDKANQEQDRTHWTYWQYNDEIKRLRANAEKLAEALGHLMAITHNTSAQQYKQAFAVLADWQKGANSNE